MPYLPPEKTVGATPPPTAPAVKGLFVIALILLLQLAQPVLLPLAIAIILTFLLSPLVRAMRRRGVDESLGAAVVVGGAVGALAIAISLLAGPATNWWERAPSNLQQLGETVDRVRRSIPLLAPPARPEPRSSSRVRTDPAPPPSDPVKDKLASEGVALTGAVLLKAGSFGITAAMVVILVYFLLASERWLIARTVQAIPRVRARVAVIGAVRAAQRDIAAFLATQAMINLGMALATGLAVWALGLPNPVLWGALAGLLNFVPYIGPLIMLGVLLVAGALTFTEFNEIVGPALAFGAINVIESNFVSPLVIGRRLELSPLAVFLTVMVGSWLWGIAGAFIAVPFLVAMRSACRRSRALRLWCVYLDRGRTEAPSMRRLLGLRRGKRSAA